MAGSRSDLFKWKRRISSKPPNHARNNVQDWIKRVERASQDAAQEVFGSGYHNVLEQVHIDDDAMIEAQDLLDSWVQEKKLDDFKMEVEFQDERWAHSASASARRTLSDGLQSHSFGLSADGSIHDEDSHDSCLSPQYKHQQQLKPGSQYDEDLDEEIAVQQFLRDMLDKKVVETNILSDLGFEDRKRKDPRPKMELRHQQVKEKSAARRKEHERSQRDRATRKEAENLARQQVMKEEKERQLQIKREELEIQKEMAKLRRAMEEEKRMKREQSQREKQQQLKVESLARQQLEEEMHRKAEYQRQEQENKEEMRRMLLQQMEDKAAQETRDNLRVLQTHFSAWWSAVVNQRIKFGKARALADWRCKLRAWSAWKAYVWHIRSDKEAQAIAWEMKEKHRKEQLAGSFRTHHILRRCFQAWQKFVHQQQKQKQLEEEHSRKASKMAALLEAAASGKLWSKHGGNMELELQDVEDEQGDHVPDSRTNTARKVDEMFSQPARKPQSFQNASAAQRSVDENDRCSRKPDHKASLKKPPKTAWTKESHHSPHRNAPNKSESEDDKQQWNKQQSRVRPKASHRQRTHSHVNQVETLILPCENKATTDTTKGGTRRELSRSRSEDVLYKDTAQPNQSLLSRADSQTNLQADGDGCLDTGRSAASSKILSREALVKSQRPTTKTVRLAMEERARDRIARKKLIEEKRRRAEDEKLARLKLEQERKEAELLAEKQELLKKKREEKRLQREREQEKQQRLEHVRQMNAQADQQYARTLLVTYGLSPWKRLVAMTQENMCVAVEHRNRGLLEACFYPWLEYTRRAGEERDRAADQLSRKILLKRSWRQWRKYGQHFVRLQGVAADYCASYLVRKYFRCWQNYVTEEELLYWEKERRAEEHNLWRLKNLAMTCWKKYIPMLKEERGREARRQELRKRVQSWLPDFHGTTSESP